MVFDFELGSMFAWETLNTLSFQQKFVQILQLFAAALGVLVEAACHRYGL